MTRQNDRGSWPRVCGQCGEAWNRAGDTAERRRLDLDPPDDDPENYFCPFCEWAAETTRDW